MTANDYFKGVLENPYKRKGALGRLQWSDFPVKKALDFECTYIYVIIQMYFAGLEPYHHSYSSSSLSEHPSERPLFQYDQLPW